MSLDHPFAELTNEELREFEEWLDWVDRNQPEYFDQIPDEIVGDYGLSEIGEEVSS